MSTTRRALKPYRELLPQAVSDNVVLDAVVDLAGDYAAIEEIVFGAIGPEANDARGPGARHTGNFHQLVDGRGVEIDFIFGGWGSPRGRSSRL